MVRWRILSFVFELFYTRLAFLVDPLLKLIFRGSWVLWQLEIESSLVGEKRILEIGCGTGSLLRELAKRSIRVVGLDSSPQMVKIAARKVKTLEKKPPSVQAKAENLPFKDRTFAIVYSMFPSPFILNPETIKNISRVLEPKGTFICLLWVRMKPKTMSAFLQKMIYGKENPTINQFIDLVKKENFITELKEVIDKKGNVRFFLFCHKPL